MTQAGYVYIIFYVFLVAQFWGNKRKWKYSIILEIHRLTSQDTPASLFRPFCCRVPFLLANSD